MKNLKTNLFSFAGLLVFFGGILIGCATSEPFTPGYVPQLSPVKEYDQTKEMSFTGQIIEVINDTTPPPIQMEEGEIDYGDERSLISVVVTTHKDGEDQTYLVQLGPKWYLDLKGIYLLSKKNISIIGTPIEVPNLVDKRGDKELSKEEGILMAKEVQMGEYKVTLRDEKGVPVWYQRGRIKGILNNWQGQLKQDEMKKYMADMMKKQTGVVPQAGAGVTTQVPTQGQTVTPSQAGGQMSAQQLEMMKKMQQQMLQGQTGTPPDVTQGQATTPSQMGGQVSPQ